MGVKLNPVITSRPLDYANIVNSVVAVDGPNIIFSLVSFKRKGASESNQPYLDRTQRPIFHLLGLMDRINFLYGKGILPIFCFDGRVSPLKRVITKDQLNDYRYYKKEYENAKEKNDLEKMKYIASSKEYYWPHILEESKHLLSALGVPVINAPGAAEAQCAELVKRGTAQYCNSQDFDSLVFGAPRVIRNLNKSLRRKERGRWTYAKIIPVEIILRKTLKILKINYFQLVDLAILIGTDYNKGVEKIGAKTALSLVKKYGHLEKIIQNEKVNYNFETLSYELLQKVREIFIFPEVIENLDDLQYNLSNHEQVKTFLCKDHSLNPERVEKALTAINHNYRKILTANTGDLKPKLRCQSTLF